MENETEKTEKKRCKKCGSRFVYIRLKERSVVCRSCGNVDLLEE